MNCANTASEFRIIQPILSPKALGAFEQETGDKVVSSQNFKQHIKVVKVRKRLEEKKKKLEADKNKD